MNKMLSISSILRQNHQFHILTFHFLIHAYILRERERERARGRHDRGGTWLGDLQQGA